MRKFGLLFLGILFFATGFTQTANGVRLEQCYAWAEAAYPLREKTPLLEQAAQLRIDQARIERLPQVEARFLAGLQSEVPDFPFDLPPPIGDPLDLPLYRLQATVQANYLIYDGGLAKARIAQEQSNLAAERQGVAVELYQLKETVNQYFFGVLLLQEKSRILATSLENLQAQQKRLEAGIRNGVVLPSAADQLQVEILKIKSQAAEANLTEQGLRQQLAELTGQTTEILAALALPEYSADRIPLKRPEFTLLELQRQSVAQRADLLEAARRPKVSAFASGGIGYPNPLNFFDEGLAPFAQIGLQATWTIHDWGKLKNDRQLLGLQQALIENQRHTLETNLNRAEAAFLQQIEALIQMIDFDRQIADLQARLLKTVSAQLENGVATAIDYALQANAETLARLQLKTHEVQLAQVKAGYRVYRGN
jgi:outer membrane protein TolC